MRYTDFEDAFSSDRMSKYVAACNGDTRKAMTLYRYNLQLSQELFTLVSCFEVTLRNRIDRQLKGSHGNDWLRDAILPGGAPTSSRQHQYDNSYMFQELDYINKLRNRIAHHEPVCFSRPNAIIDTAYALNQYARMMRLFSWMDIDGASLMFGLDHVGQACGKIMCL